LTLLTGFSNLFVSMIPQSDPASIHADRADGDHCITGDCSGGSRYFQGLCLQPVVNNYPVFIRLIITNCIVLGRAGLAMANPPVLSFFDGIGNGKGTAPCWWCSMHHRRLFGAGKVLGYAILPTVNDGGWYR
jgi:Na+-transporting NADH:ubiquinone oxidoreductase subunit D